MEPDRQAGLVNVEEPTQPAAVEDDHAWGPDLGQQPVDLGLPPPLQGVGLATATPGAPGVGLENATSRTHTAPGHIQAGGLVRL